MFEEPEDPANRSFFSEIIASISDVKFSHCGRYFLTRDFLTLKLWDLNMERGPLETYHMHDYLRSKLCSLYENDFIFDRFECGWNGSDRCVSWLVRVVLGRCGGDGAGESMCVGGGVLGDGVELCHSSFSFPVVPSSVAATTTSFAFSTATLEWSTATRPLET